MADAPLDPQRADLEAIQVLRQELPKLLSSDDAKSLAAELTQVLSQANDPVERPKAIARARDAISRYPQARERLDEIIPRIQGKFRLDSYQGVAGRAQVIPPGTLMACPKDPNHYQKYLRIAGQTLRCPQHEVDLIPLEQVGR
jgi:hypothetical protein